MNARRVVSLVAAVMLFRSFPAFASDVKIVVKQWVYSPGPSPTIIEVTVPFVPKR